MNLVFLLTLLQPVAHSASLPSGFASCEKIMQQFVGHFLRLTGDGKLEIAANRNVIGLSPNHLAFTLKQSNLNSEGCTQWQVQTNEIGQVRGLSSRSPQAACQLTFEPEDLQCFVKTIQSRYSRDACLDLRKIEDAHPLFKHCGLLLRQGPVGLKQGPASYTADAQKLALLHATQTELTHECASAEAQVYFLTQAQPPYEGCREFSELTREYVNAHPSGTGQTARTETSAVQLGK